MYRHLVNEIYQTIRRPGPKVGRPLGATTRPTVGDIRFSTAMVRVSIRVRIRVSVKVRDPTVGRVVAHSRRPTQD